MSGITMAIGYGLGTFGSWLWRYLDLPVATRSTTAGKVVLGVTLGVVAVVFLVSVWRQVGWQNDVRDLFGMEPIGPSVWLPIVP